MKNQRKTIDRHCGGNWSSERVFYRTPDFVGVINWTGSYYGTFASQVQAGGKLFQACNRDPLAEICGAKDCVEIHSHTGLLMRHNFERKYFPK